MSFAHIWYIGRGRSGVKQLTSGRCPKIPPLVVAGLLPPISHTQANHPRTPWPIRTASFGGRVRGTGGHVRGKFGFHPRRPNHMLHLAVICLNTVLNATGSCASLSVEECLWHAILEEVSPTPFVPPPRGYKLCNERPAK